MQKLLVIYPDPELRDKLIFIGQDHEKAAGVDPLEMGADALGLWAPENFPPPPSLIWQGMGGRTMRIFVIDC